MSKVSGVKLRGIYIALFNPKKQSEKASVLPSPIVKLNATKLIKKDLLFSCLGNDTVTGREGSEIFVISQVEGIDLITDVNSGVDLIGFSDGLTFNDLFILLRK